MLQEAPMPEKQDSGKVGSDPEAAKKFGNPQDFGAPENDLAQREYVSQRTRHDDPGAAPEHAGAPGSRTAGAGGNESGPGSSSGGDLDPDIIGVGTGGSG